MKVILLGTAAGGGYPQWNCACEQCRRAGADDAPPRSQDCVAVSADGRRWLLLNASPDIRAQILATPALAAGPGPRQSPITGAVLTDAELDHTLGLLLLRESAHALHVHAPNSVLQALRDGFPLRGIVDAYGGWNWHPAGAGFDAAGLRFRVLAVGAKRPKYAADLQPASHALPPASHALPPASHALADPWVVAYRVEDPATGGSFVYAPCLASWPEGFDAFVDGAGYAAIDGTFYAADEMPGATAAGVSTGAQRRMGHLPITESLPLLREHPGVRWAYTHLNNTNPVLCTSSAAYAEVRAAGVDLPVDGTVLEL